MRESRRLTFWFSPQDEKLLMAKINSQGFKGRGKLERFMEAIARSPFILVHGDLVKVTLEPMHKKDE